MSGERNETGTNPLRPNSEITAMKAKTTIHTNSHSNQETTMSTKNTKSTKPTTTTHQETTMTTASRAAHATTQSTTTSAVAAQLQAIEQACGYGDPLPDADRTTSDALIRRVPTSIVDRIVALAVRGGGTVAGIAFDPDTAKAALAAADDADAVATSALMLARRAQDQSIRLRSGVAGDVSAIRTAMVGYAKTSQGASLRQENDEIRSLAKQHKAAAKGRKTRAEKAATDAASTAATATETPPNAETAPPTVTVAPTAAH
jgi:hypothetical protein